MGLDREFDQLSKNIWFTGFGSVNNFELNFEFNPLNRIQIKRKSLFELLGLGGKGNWAGPTGLTVHSGRLTSGVLPSVAK